jgi:AcrR family transcriptional regulator
MRMKRRAARGRGPGRPRSRGVDKALLDAATEEFRQKGYRAMSMGSIAARAGVSKVSLYRRWPTKAAVAADVLRLMSEDSPMADSGSLAADLKALLAKTIGAPGAAAAAQTIMRTMGEIADDPQLMAIYRERILVPRLAQVRLLVERARARGELRQDLSTDLAAALVGGPIFLYYLALVTNTDVALPDKPADGLAKLVLGGISKRRPTL